LRFVKAAVLTAAFFFTNISLADTLPGSAKLNQYFAVTAQNAYSFLSHAAYTYGMMRRR